MQFQSSRETRAGIFQSSPAGEGMTGKRQQTCCLVGLALGVIGAGASVASIYATPAEGLTTLGCGLKSLDCTKALTSRFSEIGGVQLGIFGVFYFTFWTLNLRAFQRTGDPVYRWTFSWVTLVGAICSLALGAIMFFVLRAPCLYCMMVHGANLGAVIFLWPLMEFMPRDRPRRENLWHFATLGAVAVLAAAALWLASENRDLQAKLQDVRQSGDQTKTLF